jgi:hypothetical protein
LRTRRERPCRRRAAEQRDELAAPQLIELHALPSQGRLQNIELAVVSQGVSEGTQQPKAGYPQGHYSNHSHTTGPLALDLDQASASGCWRWSDGNGAPVGRNGGMTTGAQFAERIELGLFTLRRWEKCACSLLLPHHRQADIA